jgi:hypothetical protein
MLPEAYDVGDFDWLVIVIYGLLINYCERGGRGREREREREREVYTSNLCFLYLSRLREREQELRKV